MIKNILQLSVASVVVLGLAGCGGMEASDTGYYTTGVISTSSYVPISVSRVYHHHWWRNHHYAPAPVPHVSGPGAYFPSPPPFPHAHVSGPGADFPSPPPFPHAHVSGPGADFPSPPPFQHAHVSGPGADFPSPPPYAGPHAHVSGSPQGPHVSGADDEDFGGPHVSGPAGHVS